MYIVIVINVCIMLQSKISYDRKCLFYVCMMILLMIFTNIAFLLFFICSSDVHDDMTFRQKNMIIDPLTCDHHAEGARSRLLSIDLSLKRMDPKQMEEIFRVANKVADVISELKGESSRPLASEAAYLPLFIMGLVGLSQC